MPRAMLVHHLRACPNAQIAELRKYRLVIFRDVRLTAGTSLGDDVRRGQSVNEVLYHFSRLWRRRDFILNE